MANQRYILTSRLNGAWRWRAVDAPSIPKAIDAAIDLGLSMRDEHEVWQAGHATLTDTKKRIVWSAPVADFKKEKKARGRT